MLQAEAKYYPDLGVPSYQEIKQTRQVRRPGKKINNGRKILIIGGPILFAYALLLVYMCIKSATLSYQINSLEKDINQLETEQNRTEYQISSIQSLERVEKIAINSLGMMKPAIDSSMLVVENPTLKVAEAKTASDKNVSQTLLEKLYTNLSRLAQK